MSSNNTITPTPTTTTTTTIIDGKHAILAAGLLCYTENGWLQVRCPFSCEKESCMVFDPSYVRPVERTYSMFSYTGLQIMTNCCKYECETKFWTEYQELAVFLFKVNNLNVISEEECEAD